MAEDVDSADRSGVSGTPTGFVNGRRHHGAYDAASDSFLVLDVNPAAAGWVWMPFETLVRGMRTHDTVENRGYVVVGAG